MDHSEKLKREIHPRENANIFSIINFIYTGRIFAKGFKKDFEDDDLYEVVKKCRSKKCADRLDHAYTSQMKMKEGKKVSIYRVMWDLYGINIVALMLLHMFGRLGTSALEPEALANLIGYFKPGQTRMTIHDALYHAALLIGCRAFHTFYFQNYLICLAEVAIQVRTSLCSLIYRKALKLSPKALENTSLGNIVTVITKDIQQFEHSIYMISSVIISIIQTVVVCYLIYRRIGPTSLIGISMVLLLIPFQAYISKVIKNLRLKMSKRTDERLQRSQETLSSIKTIKMYTWEQVFADKIGEARYKELRTMLKSSYAKISLMVSSHMVGLFAFNVMIMMYIYIYHDMSAEDIFYLQGTFGTLRYTVGRSFSMGFSRIGELTAAMKRVNNILMLEELTDVVDKPDDEPQIDIRNVSVNLQNRDILKDINLKLEKGLNIITGTLGCGKSSLIKVILRDYPISEEGEVRTRGRRSYASQDPWLFPSSIKQNILFGEKYDFKRYQQVVSACALEYDFEILEKGDDTIVADRGMNLSKGQQARINLARAIYKDSDIYLIDDALTALDTRVQEHIFTYCIQGLLRDKCVVLITHNAKHIKLADRLVIMNEGTIQFVGNQQNITNELLETFESVEPEKKSQKIEESAKDTEDKTDKTKLLVEAEPRKKQVYHENKKAGAVDPKLYLSYVTLGGGYFLAIIMLLSFAVTSFIDGSSQKLLSFWINRKTSVTGLKETYSINRTVDLESLLIENATTIFLNSTYNVSTNIVEDIIKLELQASKYLNLYALMIVGNGVLEMGKFYIIFRVGYLASINLHKNMINKILHATMAFFDSFFIGNVLNRFAQDLNVVDEQLITIMAHLVEDLFRLTGVVGLIASVNWKFLIPAFGLTVFLVVVRYVYIRSARSLKRLEAATRSPIVGHLNSTMEGLTTIRAFKAQEILKNEFDRHQDLFTSAVYTSWCVRGAFSFIMEIASIAFVASVISRFLFFESGNQAGDVGLTLNQAGLMSMMIHMGLLNWSEVENSMTSFERASEYTTVESENQTGSEIEGWPSKGEIIYKNVSLTYTNSHEKVLKDISFSVKANTKIGVVGRTGAGKSSVISTLYRLYKYEGEIIIDGVELKTLALKFLRQHIAIIPQDPIMFSGTVRSNVDPLEEFTDEEVWKALHKVHLDKNIPDLQTQEADINFSTGQRQLICLARAIIRRNKIVVLDEATANMDPETEQLAQKIIDENFASCTLIIIAHRLDAILNCDNVMVLNRGEIVEFDHPNVLLENKKSLFSEMMRNSTLNADNSKDKKTL